jgi:hypothetical protein
MAATKAKRESIAAEIITLKNMIFLIPDNRLSQSAWLSSLRLRKQHAILNSNGECSQPYVRRLQSFDAEGVGDTFCYWLLE